jgi:hypothetical protein
MTEEQNKLELAVEKAILDVLNNRKSTAANKMQAANMGLKLIEARKSNKASSDDESFFGKK